MQRRPETPSSCFPCGLVGDERRDKGETREAVSGRKERKERLLRMRKRKREHDKRE